MTDQYLTDLRSIGQSNDELGRFLEVLRFWFTKDLVSLACVTYGGPKLRELQKYIKGKPCKPYNSVLGEFFRVGGGILFDDMKVTRMD